MRAFLDALRNINLGCIGDRCSGSPTVLKNVLNEKCKIKHVPLKCKTSVIILQVFVFHKAYHLVLRDSALVHLESATSVHTTAHFLKVYFFVSCFPTMPSNRAKLKYGTMKLKAYEKIIWMIEPGAGPKGFLLVSPERCTLTVT